MIRYHSENDNIDDDDDDESDANDDDRTGDDGGGGGGDDDGINAAVGMDKLTLLCDLVNTLACDVSHVT